MVFNIKRIPCLAVQVVLPSCIHLFQLLRLELRLNPVGNHIITGHVLKMEHGIEKLTVAFFDKFKGTLRRHHRRFTDSKAIIFIKHVLEFPEIFFQMRTVHIVLDSGRRRKRKTVRKTRLFRDKSDHVLTEAVNAHIEPETHNILDFLTYLRVIHVQVRLTLGENMKIVFVKLLAVFPSLSLERRSPVIRLLAVLFTLAPEVIVMIRIVVAFFTF